MLNHVEVVGYFDLGCALPVEEWISYLFVQSKCALL